MRAETCPQLLFVDGALASVSKAVYTESHPCWISTKSSRRSLRRWRRKGFPTGGEDQVVLDLLLVGPPVLDTVWQTRQSFEWEGMKVWIVSREGLIALKRLRGSLQDLVDIERLEGQGP